MWVAWRLAETGGYHITTGFLLSHVALAALTDTETVLIGTLVGSALGLLSHPLFGAWSDRIGCRPVLLLGSVFTIAFGVVSTLAARTSRETVPA